ncbi:32125_t:CDS:1, partial [Racocetra persica]
MSYCYIFTNVFTAEGYKRLFQTLFQVIKEITGEFVKFYHIHNEGWACILAVLDLAQAKGLGLAIEKLDNSKDWNTHLLYIFKS